MTRLQEGVYELRVLTLAIRIIVVGQLPLAEHNAMLHLFSAREELLRYGRDHFQPYSEETSTLLYELFQTYSEDPDMADKLKEFAQETIEKFLKSLPPEKRLEGLPAEELPQGPVACGRSPQGPCLRKIASRDCLRKKLSRRLPPETLEGLVRKLKANGSSPKTPVKYGWGELTERRRLCLNHHSLDTKAMPPPQPRLEVRSANSDRCTDFLGCPGSTSAAAPPSTVKPEHSLSAPAAVPRPRSSFARGLIRSCDPCPMALKIWPRTIWSPSNRTRRRSIGGRLCELIHKPLRQLP